MKKLNLYLNEDQYERLSILAREKGEEVEEYANERFYDLLIQKWCERRAIDIERMFNDPETDWED